MFQKRQCYSEAVLFKYCESVKLERNMYTPFVQIYNNFVKCVNQ